MVQLVKRAGSGAAFERPSGMPEPLHRLLMARGIGSVDEASAFLTPSIDQLHDPLLLSCMEEAISRVREAVQRRETVCVYGDYDVDGVCATTILLTTLRALGLDAKGYIPSRHDEGYGLNEAAVRKIAEWASLMITVDCGVTAASEVDLARRLGLSVIVTDHHQPGELLPNCALVNPLLSGYPFPSLCGAGVAFKLAQALTPEIAPELIDLAALATVADVVPLQSENRVLVALGLQRMRECPRPGLLALAEATGVNLRTLRASHIAFALAPRLNADGRLGDARRALDLLMAESVPQARPLAEALERENTGRREVEQHILCEARERMLSFDYESRRAIVLHDEHWNVGVIGLAASRLAEQYCLPVVLLSGDGELLSGSCRSIPGVDIHRALTMVAPLLTRFGGHKQAAGLSLRRENLESFERELSQAVLSIAGPTSFVPKESYDLEMELSELDEPLIRLISRLEPFGFGNPQPVFLSRARILNARRVGQDGAHLSLRVSDSLGPLSAVWFRMGELEKEMHGEKLLLYQPKLNSFNGQTSVQLELRRAVPPDHLSQPDENRARLDILLQAFLTDRLYNRSCAAQNRADFAGFRDADAPIEAMARSPFGTLAVAGSFEAAEDFLASARAAGAEMSFDLLIGAWPGAEQPRNALCVLPLGESPSGYPRLFSLDTPLALWAALPTDAQECSVRRAPWLDSLPGTDELRRLYRAARALTLRPYRAGTLFALMRSLTEEAPLDAVTAAAGLPVLEAMGLVEYTPDPPHLALLPMKKRDPSGCPLFQFIQEIRCWGGDHRDRGQEPRERAAQ